MTSDVKLKVIKNVDIDELNLSVRAWNCLRRANLDTVQDIVDNYDNLSRVRNLGQKCHNEVLDKIKPYVEKMQEHQNQEGFSVTCEDCIHHDLCFDNGTLFIHFTTTGRKAENVETNCPFKNFKNKADFVEVVRCKDCKFRGTDDCSNSYYLECEGAYVDPMKDDDFCSYGQRK